MNSDSRKIPLKILALVFALFLAAVAYWANTGTTPAVLVSLVRFPNSDRAGHFILYAVLAFLFNSAYAKYHFRLVHWDLFPGTILAFLAATMEEISQVFTSTRTFDLLDLGLGYLGILCAQVLTVFFNKRKMEARHDHARP